MDGMSAGLVLEDPSDEDSFRTMASTPTIIESGRSLRTRQHTLRNTISCTGIGLHSGRRVDLVFRPAPPDSGIVFRRSDIGIDIPARFDHVVDTRLCTVVGVEGVPDARVSTVEHIMAAFAACGIDNAIVEVNSVEVPVLDGSSGPFVFLFDCAGRIEQNAPRATIEVLKPVRVEDGQAFAELRPSAAAGLSLSLSIEFAGTVIGRQAYTMRLTEQGFRQELADCRTFTLRQEIDALRAAGLARGGSLENAVVVDGQQVLNPAGLRRPDEFVRHKMLDAVGDLALAGHPLRGSFVGHRSGHGLNNRLLRALLADSSAWRPAGRTVSEALSQAA